MNVSDYIVVVVTAGSNECAERIARVVVERRLAACAQVSGPMDSTYWWKNNIEIVREWRVEMKTRASLFESLSKTIFENHPYDTPEIIALPIVDGNPRYLAWIATETSSAS